MDEFARAFGATDEISSRQKLKNENRDLKNRLAEAEERIRSLEARITSNLPQGLLADLPARQTPSAQVVFLGAHSYARLILEQTLRVQSVTVDPRRWSKFISHKRESKAPKAEIKEKSEKNSTESGDTKVEEAEDGEIIEEKEEGEEEEPEILPATHDPFPPNGLEHQIINQVDYYFSARNLKTDGFLKEKISQGEGWAEVKLILGFKKVKLLTKDEKEFTSAVRKSKSVELSEDLTKLRARKKSLKESKREEPTTMPSGIVTYFQTFCIDRVGVRNISSSVVQAQEVAEFVVPRHRRLNAVPLPLDGTPGADGKLKVTPRMISEEFRKRGCWNCGGFHPLTDCRVPRNQKVILLLLLLLLL
ncbi:hypothetical protein AAMO2058_001388700 [Amorphochlora amoebiformis]